MLCERGTQVWVRVPRVAAVGTKLAVKGESKVAVQGCVLGVTLSQPCLSSPCLAGTQSQVEAPAARTSCRPAGGRWLPAPALGGLAVSSGCRSCKKGPGCPRS